MAPHQWKANSIQISPLIFGKQNLECPRNTLSRWKACSSRPDLESIFLRDNILGFHIPFIICTSIPRLLLYLEDAQGCILAPTTQKWEAREAESHNETLKLFVFLLNPSGYFRMRSTHALPFKSFQVRKGMTYSFQDLPLFSPGPTPEESQF